MVTAFCRVVSQHERVPSTGTLLSLCNIAAQAGRAPSRMHTDDLNLLGSRQLVMHSSVSLSTVQAIWRLDWQNMALTATPWTPGAHEAAAGFVSRRMSLEHPSQAAHPSGGTTGSLDSSQLENLYTAFNQGLAMSGRHTAHDHLLTLKCNQ